MAYMEMKNTVLFKYHKNIDFWWKLLGEFFEGTNGFTQSFMKRCTMDGRKVEITWIDYEWSVKEV